MPSFYRVLRDFFRANPADSRKSSHTRPASFEVLEKRNLLAGDVAAALTGTVVVDRTDDGVSNDDTAVAGAVVQLYRDGGDGIFDGGQGDDAPLGSQTSDAAGQYRFDGLTPGTYFVQQLPALGLLQRDDASVQRVVITDADMAGEIRTPIDTFETPQLLDVWAPGDRIAMSNAAAPEAIGGERDLFVEITSAIGQLESGAGREPEILHFDSSYAADGVRLLTWDGIDEGADTINYRGLGGYDLADDGMVTGIKMLHGADHPPARVVLRMYTDQNNWSQGVLEIAQTDSSATAPGLLLLDDFTIGGGAGADFTDLGAIELEIEANPELDGQISRIDTFGPRILEADFLNLQPLSLGNLVWFDADNNGSYASSNEQGIGQVSVDLYLDTDADGEFSAADTFLANQQTGVDGTYRFDNLLPADYLVHLASSNFAPGGALEGLVLTTGALATDPDNDIDNDNNGLLTSGGATATTAVSLASLAEPVDDGDSNANSNLTVDIGYTLFDLSITKSDSPDPAIAGESLTYTLEVTNHGPADAAGVVVVDALPDGLSNPAVVSSQGTAGNDGNTISAALGTLPVGASATVTIVADIDPGFTGRLENLAVVSGRRDTAQPVPNDPWIEMNLTNNEDAASTEVVAEIDLMIDKSDDPDAVVAGQQLTYRLVVTNNGPSVATGVVATDSLPDGVSFASATASQGSAVHADGTVTANLGALAPGASATVVIVGDVDPAQTVTLLNVASVVGNEEETNLDNNRDEEPTEVNPLIDLAIDKSDDPDAVVAGQQLTYTLVVTNNGPSVATGVVATDVLPGGVSFASATVSQGSAAHADGTVTAELGTLAAGASATVTIVGDVDPAQTVTLLNVATVVGNEEETRLDNNRDEEPTAVQSSVDLVIDKADQPDPVIAGQQLTYTLHVTNQGPSTATGVTVTDQLPDAVQLQSASSSQGLATQSGGIVTVNLGTLAPGASAEVTLLTVVDSGAPATLINSAVVSSDQPDANPEDNSDEEPTSVRGLFDLEVVKTDSADPIMAGEELTYTIIVSNNGPSDATDVVMIDDLPNEVAFVSAETTQGTVLETDGRVCAELGYLANGQSETVTILVQVGFDVVDEIENVAIVDGNPVQTNPLFPGTVIKESNLDNNFDEEPTLVQAALASVSGYVYVDLNNDGQRGLAEPAIPGVEVQLTGTNVLGNSVSRVDVTDSDGAYSFLDLLPGSYSVTEVQPSAFRDGKDTPGSVAGGTGVLQYSLHDDMFAGIGLAGGVDAVEFNFGELLHTVSKRDYLSSSPGTPSP